MEIKSLTAVLTAALLAAGCSTSSRVVAPTSPAEVGELRAGTGYLKGYLAQADLPDSLALLPPPPAEGSAALAADTAAWRELTKLQGTPRGAMAVSDANLRFPEAASVFSCALGVQISEQATPNLNMLLRRTLTDAGLTTYKAKDKYVRTRPFVALKAGSCTPKEEAYLAKDGSYPSGHSAVGWGWALVLTEVAPDRANAILQRGRAFSQSRGICGVHWQSDIEAGRLVGAAAVARLQTNEVFVAQMTAAREEIAKARAAGAGASPSAACTAEAAIIAGSSSLAP
ncbi:phosphatase PAP2 family protein [Variovorax sp. J22R133]|uniref:acid phosphatase n=1 Tax=Variovorax brevis TaxID=3053503 RepID=UPI00257683FC|nr:phosphatase PAP2 family protein [Variovorax sp. J22R133]MDM0113148.1 phosphatase PAP2 family protein [Variovorax sp. J22R133]